MFPQAVFLLFCVELFQLLFHSVLRKKIDPTCFCSQESCGSSHAYLERHILSAQVERRISHGDFTIMRIRHSNLETPDERKAGAFLVERKGRHGGLFYVGGLMAVW